jgi:hypothetical protein
MRRIIGTIGALAVVAVLSASWIPLQNPAGGPYFGKLDPEAHTTSRSTTLAMESRTRPGAGPETST